MVTPGKPGAFDTYSMHCPARLVLDRLGDKWALLILRRLQQGPTRFNALRRDIQGSSQKVLSQVLKRLERDGLVSRTVYPTVPVAVEYALTPLGQTLKQAVGALIDWAEASMDAILIAQQAYDERASEQATV